MYKKIALGFLVAIPSFMFSASLDEYVDQSKCSQIIDKQLYEICYSYEVKGPLSGWVKLNAVTTEENDIKKRPKFYNEDNIPMKYRTKSADYNGFGEDWNRGHFIVADADFDYDDKALAKAYTMANIIPQSAVVNQKTWIKVENMVEFLLINQDILILYLVAKYDEPNHKIANDIVIPTKLYRIYYNNEANFEKCFEYDNVLDVDYKMID